MIFDRLDNWEYYYSGSVSERVFDFLRSLTPDSEEKKYNLQGDDIFAQVRRYNTCSPESAVLETHQKYVDIHMVLIGSERIECFSKDELVVDTPYDELKDAAFYNHNCSSVVRVNLLPGFFVMFPPQDAHMPGLMIESSPEPVKKVVVKVKVDLLTAQYC